MPIDATVPDSERPVFAATITPHRSLGPDGFRLLMLICGVVTAGAALRIALLGFWPVSGFLALDLVGLYIAFKVNYRRGRAIEEVVLTPGELLFRQTSHRGQAREWRLNPLWTRLDEVVDDEYGMQRLMLVSRGQHILIARELSPGEREHFAGELGRALAQVKRGF
jgi:uncharacterized membrane protein